MHKDLLDILCCPQCKGDLDLNNVSEEAEERVVQGNLNCSACSVDYPIKDRVPRLVVAQDSVKTIGNRFNFQWVSWDKGGFEDDDRTYGFDLPEQTEWMTEQLKKTVPLGEGDWFVDIGCGSGGPIKHMAQHSPQGRFVGVDLGGDAMAVAAERFKDQPNLMFVQANVLQSPFKGGSFRWALSQGVLHHTPNTREAFAAFRKLLSDTSGMLIWLYPTPKEGPEWAFVFAMRDYAFLGQSWRIPASILWWISYIWCGVLFPIGEIVLARSTKELSRDLPFFNPTKLPAWQRYRTQSFFLYDTLLPKFQWRHTAKEVEGWLEEEELDHVLSTHGYYVAKNEKA